MAAEPEGGDGLKCGACNRVLLGMDDQPRTVAAQGAHAGGGRSVHSSPATPASRAAGAEPAVGAASVEEAR